MLQFEPFIFTKAEIRAIPGHPSYFASTDGRIYSRARADGVLRELRPVRGGKDGAYRYVQLGKSFRSGVHQIVALVFLPKPASDRKLVVRHKDNDASNNVLSNLEWGTQSENLMDCHRHGTALTGETNPAAKHTEQFVARVRRMRRDGMRYRDIGKALSIPPQTAWKLATGSQWKHVAETTAPRVRKTRKVNRARD